MNNMNNQFVKRCKSFLWRALMVGVAGFIDYSLTNLGILEMPNVATLIIGGLLGEVSKWVNNNIQRDKSL
jgi:hypothetical protein